MAELPRIPISAPDLSGREEEYVVECVRSTWISSKGSFIERFEHEFATLVEARHAIACNNGTSALHLALIALGIGPGDEVIVPTLTYVASANAVRYCGATPRFVDVLPGTWNLDPADVERKIGAATKAIMPVHLFGAPADMAALQVLSERHGIPLVEDAAEAHGASVDGRTVGALGAIGTFSLYGNKIVTTGEGGVVVTNDAELAARVALYKGQGQDPNRPYWFPVVGFNYRMTNVQAAIGLAQLETFARKLADRARVAAWYDERLRDAPDVELQRAGAGTTHAHWMVAALIASERATERDAIGLRLAEAGIETRPVFYPLHTLPPYAPVEPDPAGYPVAVEVASRGLCLPTWGGLREAQVDRICTALVDALDRVSV